MYKNQSIGKYMDDLAARMPAPGGGSASALAAGLGAALISMVVNFTLGKPKYIRYERELKGIIKKSEKARSVFLDLVDRDVAAYKSKDMRKALSVPLDICRLCFDAISLCPALITKGNKNLISDVAVAAVLLESGFVSAMFNVEINLKFIGDKALAKKLRKELQSKKRRIQRIRLDMEVKVGKIIRG
jgi:methenyltetrahydrofolate cyclohydrolase